MISRLLGNYARQVALPWSKKLPRKQRVWFAVYEPDEERRVRAKLAQFETHTLEAKHGWHMVDLTGLLPEWIATHEYREAIFNEPELLSPNNELEDRAVERVSQACSAPGADDNCVVAVIGLAASFDYIRVSSLIERIEDTVNGRLLVFFPGEYTGNVYRFMCARDGFNYMAVPITATESFINP
jgi:hypothetical protein